jgi:hypothetical protein
VNIKGHPQTLVAKHMGNANARKSGVFSATARAEATAEIAAGLAMDAGAFIEADQAARFAYARGLLDLLVADIHARGVSDRQGKPRRQVSMLMSCMRVCNEEASQLATLLDAHASDEDETRDTARAWTKGEGARILRRIANDKNAPPSSRIAAVAYLDRSATGISDREFDVDLAMLSDEQLEDLLIPITTHRSSEEEGAAEIHE